MSRHPNHYLEELSPGLSIPQAGLMVSQIYEWQPMTRRHEHTASDMTATLLRINRMLASPDDQALSDTTAVHEYIGRSDYPPSGQQPGLPRVVASAAPPPMGDP